MSEQPSLDLRGLANVDSPEVVRAALKTFRRRLWTRYLWIGLAIVLGAVALILGNRPSDLRAEIEGANLATLPEQVIRVGGTSVAIERVVDLGDTMGIHFITLADPSRSSPGAPGIWVQGERSSMISSAFDTYVEVPKSRTGQLVARVGPTDCVAGPPCPGATTFTIDLRKLMIPPDIWRAGG